MRASSLLLLIAGVLALTTAAAANQVTLNLQPIAVGFPSPGGQVRIDCDVLSGSEAYVDMNNLEPDSYDLVLDSGPNGRLIIGNMQVDSRGDVSFHFHIATCFLGSQGQILVLRGTREVLFAVLP